MAAISITPFLTVLSCGTAPSDSKSLYQKIDGQNLTISNDNIWGPTKKITNNYIISELSSKLNLTKEEQSSLKVDPSLKNLNTITDGKISESQKVRIYVDNSTLEIPVITINWNLTKNQTKIYGIYKKWPEATMDYFPSTQRNMENLIYAKLWANNDWDTAKVKHYNHLTINGSDLKPQIDKYINTIWNPDKQGYSIKDSLISLPDSSITAGIVKSVNDIYIKNGNAKFPLLVYNSESPGSTGLNLTYDTDYSLIHNTLKNFPILAFSESNFSKTSKDASDPFNRKVIMERLIDQNFEIGNIKDGLSFTGSLKKDTSKDIHNISILYNGKPQNITIPISI